MEDSLNPIPLSAEVGPGMEFERMEDFFAPPLENWGGPYSAMREPQGSGRVHVQPEKKVIRVCLTPRTRGHDPISHFKGWRLQVVLKLVFEIGKTV